MAERRLKRSGPTPVRTGRGADRVCVCGVQRRRTLDQQHDYKFHHLATLVIPSSGDYAAQAKVVAQNTSSGFGEQIACKLTAHTRSGGVDDFDGSIAETEPALDATIPLDVVHSFSGRGSITLACRLGTILFPLVKPAVSRSHTATPRSSRRA
jgi:hypothetical protein